MKKVPRERLEREFIWYLVFESFKGLAPRLCIDDFRKRLYKGRLILDRCNLEEYYVLTILLQDYVSNTNNSRVLE